MIHDWLRIHCDYLRSESQSLPAPTWRFPYSFSEFPYQACLNIYWQAEDLGNVVALMIIRQLAMLRLSWILTEVEKVRRLRVCQV